MLTDKIKNLTCTNCKIKGTFKSKISKRRQRTLSKIVKGWAMVGYGGPLEQ